MVFEFFITNLKMKGGTAPGRVLRIIERAPIQGKMVLDPSSGFVELFFFKKKIAIIQKKLIFL